jgi:hypothetical protein
VGFCSCININNEIVLALLQLHSELALVRHAMVYAKVKFALNIKN